MKYSIVLTILLMTPFAMAQKVTDPAAEEETITAPADLQTTPDLPPEPEKFILEEQGKILTLKEAHQLATTNHPAFANIDETIVQADTMIQSAWAMLLPNLSANGQLIRNQNEVSMAFPDFEALMSDPTLMATGNIPTTEMAIQEKWQSSLSFSANITLFNARSIPLIKMAYDMVDQDQLQAQIARNDLLFAVTSSFYQLGTMRELVKVYSENLSIAEEYQKSTEALFQVGQATKIDTTRAKIRVAEMQKMLLDAVDAYRTAKKSLAIFMGTDTNFIPEAQTTSTKYESDVNKLVDTALEDRMELQSAQKDIAIAERNKSETLTKWIPKFDATWTVTHNSVEGFGGEKTNWMLIFGANWSILEGGGRIAELKSRKSQLRMAQNKLKQIKMEIETDVYQKHQSAVTQERSIHLSEELVELSEENYELILNKYNVGMSTGLELNDAMKELATKKLEVELDRLSYNLAVLELRKTIGEYNSLAISAD